MRICTNNIESFNVKSMFCVSGNLNLKDLWDVHSLAIGDLATFVS